MSPARKLQVEYVSIGAIKPDPRNPRQHGAKQIRQIALSMRVFGNNVPILLDRDNQIVAGHGRFQASQQLGLAEIPVVRLEHLSAAQARAFAIADNRLTDNSCWDDRMLAEALRELSLEDLHFDLEATGFDAAEIDLRIEGLSLQSSDPDPADELPEPKESTPITRPGDLWILGDHRVLCSNALQLEPYATVLGKEKAHVVFTDPPYNVRIAGHASGLGAVQHREFEMAAGEMSAGEFTGFLTTACAHHARFTVDGAIHYVCMDWRHTDALLAAGKIAYSELKNICVWSKNNAGMGSFYRSHTNSFLSSNPATDRTEIISSWAGTAGIARMSGPIPAPARSAAPATRAIF